MEFCFECAEYPCKRYAAIGKVDSFISYRNVIRNFSEAKKNLKKYLKDLKLKHGYLRELISKHNDGRSKGFYCLAVDLLPVAELTGIMKAVKSAKLQSEGNAKQKAQATVELLKTRARALNIDLLLRK